MYMIISNINHELCRFNAHSFSISHAHTTRAHLGLVVPRLVLPWACPGGKKIKNSLRSRSKSFAGLSSETLKILLSFASHLRAIFHFKYYSQGYTWAWVSYKRIDLGRLSPNTSPANGSPMWCSVSNWVHVHMLLCCGDSPYPVTSPRVVLCIRFWAPANDPSPDPGWSWVLAARQQGLSPSERLGPVITPSSLYRAFTVCWRSTSCKNITCISM